MRTAFGVAQLILVAVLVAIALHGARDTARSRREEPIQLYRAKALSLVIVFLSIFFLLTGAILILSPGA